MYKKAWCSCEVVVLLIKLTVFFTFSLPSASLDLKVPITAWGTPNWIDIGSEILPLSLMLQVWSVVVVLSVKRLSLSFTLGAREDVSAFGRWSPSSHAGKNLWYPGYLSFALPVNSVMCGFIFSYVSLTYTAPRLKNCCCFLRSSRCFCLSFVVKYLPG